MRRLLIGVACGVLVIGVARPVAASTVEAVTVFEQLKSMAGIWRAVAAGEGEEAGAKASLEGVHEFEVSAAGTVVMETMSPGTEHEMINMYHLDGEDLVLTHYCAAGNQPTMRLDRAASSDELLVFDFTGGTNLDPAVDHHIHSAKLKIIDGDHVESMWTGYSGGVEAGVMTFHLTRGES